MWPDMTLDPGGIEGKQHLLDKAYEIIEKIVQLGGEDVLSNPVTLGPFFDTSFHNEIKYPKIMVIKDKKVNYKLKKLLVIFTMEKTIESRGFLNQYLFSFDVGKKMAA